MACGGASTETTCVQLIDGQWITSHHLQTTRYRHTSWSLPDGSGDVLLIGGYDGDDRQSTELVKTDGTTEVGTMRLEYKS